jgi:hypothetical protein
MTIVFILASISLLLIAFFIGYNLALHNESLEHQRLGEEQDSLEPIFARMDREWKYTEQLNRPFTDGK